MEELEFKRIYSAKIESVRQLEISPTGLRTYEVFFRNGKKMYYQRTQKQSMVLRPGLHIRFTAFHVEPLYWVIEDVLCAHHPDELMQLYHQE